VRLALNGEAGGLRQFGTAWGGVAARGSVCCRGGQDGQRRPDRTHPRTATAL